MLALIQLSTRPNQSSTPWCANTGFRGKGKTEYNTWKASGLLSSTNKNDEQARKKIASAIESVTHYSGNPMDLRIQENLYCSLYLGQCECLLLRRNEGHYLILAAMDKTSHPWEESSQVGMANLTLLQHNT